MRNPQKSNPNLADALFAVKDADLGTLVLIAKSFGKVSVIKARVWAIVTVLNFIFLILLPLYALVVPSEFSRATWLIIPGIFLGFILALSAPKGTV